MSMGHWVNTTTNNWQSIPTFVNWWMAQYCIPKKKESNQPCQPHVNAKKQTTLRIQTFAQTR